MIRRTFCALYLELLSNGGGVNIRRLVVAAGTIIPAELITGAHSGSGVGFVVSALLGMRSAEGERWQRSGAPQSHRPGHRSVEVCPCANCEAGLVKPYRAEWELSQSEEYERAQAGIEATSVRLITSEHSPNLGLYQCTISGPLDYLTQATNDLILYGVSGSSTVHVAGESLPLGERDAVFVPCNYEFRHTGDEDLEILIAWSPAPDGKRMH
jgi:hypothetical protein